jgi:hypothetical protein
MAETELAEPRGLSDRTLSPLNRPGSGPGVADVEVVTDSPYRTSAPILTPGGGALAGVAASLLMLLVVSLSHPPSAPTARDLLIRFGSAVVPPARAGGEGVLLFTAGVLHLAIGAILGLLYGVSQHHAGTRGLIAVGVFYGFVIWIAGRLFSWWFFRPTLHGVLRSSSWLLACLCYGLFLAGCAIWADRHRPLTPAQPLPID